jgi:hypothetical protein
MGLTAYAPPDEIPVPELFSDETGYFVPGGGYDRASDEYIRRLREYVKGISHHKLAGRCFRLPWADGYAQYMIVDGRRCICLPLGDAWNVPDHQLRGLTVKELTAMTSAPLLFGEKGAFYDG